MKKIRDSANLREFKSAWNIVASGAKSGAFAGAVGLVSLNGKILLHKSCGFASIYPSKVPMFKDSIFDIASVSKAVATTTAIMMLLERKVLSLDQKVVSLLPEFADEGNEWKKLITVRHLLTHTSGLPSWSDLYRRHRTRESVLNEVLKEIDPTVKPGTTFSYSDIGFVQLGQIVELVSGKRLDSFASNEIFRPLGMVDTYYNPMVRREKRFVSTEYSNWRGEFVRGSVHDENAYAMGGVSGHAGLFSTAVDLALFCNELISGQSELISPDAVRLMITDHTSKLGGYVGLGWWIKSKTTPDIGPKLPPGSFGHNGYTGTSVWMDPESKLVIILLTNRIHPVREGDPARDKSVGIMMSRKITWSQVNRAFQDSVVKALGTQAT